MALSGSVTTNSFEVRNYTVRWSASQSIANNTSTINWTVSCAGGTVWYAERTLIVTIAGRTVVNKSNRVQRYAGTIASGSFTLPHNSSGAASFSISIQAAVYTSVVNLTGSGNFTLNTIPRASSVSLADGSSSIIGVEGGVVFNVKKASSGFTHTLSYQFGDDSGVICEKKSDTSISWTMPTDFLYQIPNSTTGKCIVTCTTYNGASAIGTSSISFNAEAQSDVIPTITGYSTESVNEKSSVIAAWNICVARYTQTRITASASGAYGSTITGYLISGGYTAQTTGPSLDYTGSIYTSSGDKELYITAIDSRGRESAKTLVDDLFVFAYSDPMVTALSAYRSESNVKQIIVQANWDFAVIDERNTVSAVLFYKPATSENWTTYGAVEKNTATILATEFEEEKSYDFRLIATDTVGNSSKKEISVSTAEVLLDFKAGGSGLGVGKVAESDDLMDVRFNAYFRENIYDKYHTLIQNGVAAYDVDADINPDTSLDTIFLTSTNVPATSWPIGQWCILQQFDSEKSLTAGRLQVAIPHATTLAMANSIVPIYTRRYLTGSNGWTEWLSEALKAWPVDSVYISYSQSSPAGLIGGVWERIENSFLWGCGEGDAIGGTGGEKTHTLAKTEVPNATGHIIFHGAGSGGTAVQNTSGICSNATSVNGYSYQRQTGAMSVGQVNLNLGFGGGAHNNMPPYTNVSVWRRTQ